jgi:uncharacterized protein
VQKPVPHKIQSHQFWLTTERTMFWEEKRTLIVSDLHFGKTGHFRKSGIAIPANVFTEDLQRLVAQIQHFQPRQLIIVGDMFHSKANKELEMFLKWRTDLPHIEIQLIQGNHDILKDDWYQSAGIGLSKKTLTVDQFHFIHDISEQEPEPAIKTKSAGVQLGYSFSGHIHPGVRIQGTGRQSLCFPCFYFGKKFAVLPAFSRFTGIAVISPDRDEDVFAIVNKSLIRLQ